MEVKLKDDLLKKILEDSGEKYSIKVGVLGSPKNLAPVAKKKPEESQKRPKKAKKEDEKKPSREYNQIEIAAVHEFGSVEWGIPRRSFLKDPLVLGLGKETKNFKFVAGNMYKNYEKLAVAAQAVIEDAFEDSLGGRWAPNSPITIEGGWMKNKKTGQLVYIEGKHSEQPLIDIGRLRKSIDYNIVKGV
jgi:hypothetical protein